MIGDLNHQLWQTQQKLDEAVVSMERYLSALCDLENRPNAVEIQSINRRINDARLAMQGVVNRHRLSNPPVTG